MPSFKGIVLAGGYGTRLYPLTRGVSKQLLPIYDKPMIYYPLSVLMLAGIRDILLITTPDDLPNFQRTLGDGKEFGLAISYAVQTRPAGLADAFLVAEHFLDGAPCCLILGDNIFYGQGFTPKLKEAVARTSGATIFAYRVKDPERFGVVEFDAEMQAVDLQEKPRAPRSNYAITGLYFCDGRALEIARSLRPSARGELEIIDLLRAYLAEGALHVAQLGRGFAWLDTGTHESLMEAGTFVHALENRQGTKIACLEEIALANGWLTTDAVRGQGLRMAQTPYGQYLLTIAGET